jgi:hypothetical protein
MPARAKRRLQLTPELELEKICSLREAYEISGLSPDAWRANYPHLIRRLSPRRLGIRLRDVLSVGGKPAA